MNSGCYLFVTIPIAKIMATMKRNTDPAHKRAANGPHIGNVTIHHDHVTVLDTFNTRNTINRKNKSSPAFIL